jgi:hypothetical protein
MVYLGDGPAEGFIVNYNTDGVALWATAIVGVLIPQNVVPTSIVLGGGSIIVSGYFNAPAITIYSAPLGTVIFGDLNGYTPYAGDATNFIVAYDTNGVGQWVNNSSNSVIITGPASTYANTLYGSLSI